MANNNFGFTQSGFVFPTVEDVRDSVLEDIFRFAPTLDLQSEKIETAFIETMISQIYCIWTAVYNQYNSQNPNFISGCFLDIYGSRFGVLRYVGESDAAYRNRILAIQAGTGQLSGSACFDSLYSSLFGISGVTDVQINLNDTSVQQGVLPPNSYEVMVLGGDDEAVASTIWNNHPIGITLSGNTFVNIIDCTGICRPVYFTRPKLVPIYLDFHVKRTGAVCGCPTDDPTVIKNAIQASLDSDNGTCFTRIGQTVHVQDFFPSIYSIQGIGITCALLSRDGLCADSEFTTLKRDEVPFFSPDCCNVTFTDESSTPCETGVYNCPPDECTFKLDIIKEADKTEITTVGEIITYTFTVTNVGVAPITDPILITDDKASVVCDPLSATGLAVGDSINCTAIYEVTYDDVIEGGVTNKAQAISGSNFSPCVELTVPYNGPDIFHEMTLTKSLASGTCTAVGNILIYSYTLTNTGNIPITGQPAITDDKIGAIVCPALPSGGLLPNQSISATARTVVTQQMLDDGECCNNARAIGTSPLGQLVSNAVTLCIECASDTSTPPSPPSDLLIQDCLNSFPVDIGQWVSVNGSVSLSANGTDLPINLLFTDNGDGTGTLSQTGVIQNGVVTITGTDPLGQENTQEIIVNCIVTTPSEVQLNGLDCPVFSAASENLLFAQFSPVFTPFTGGVAPFTMTQTGLPVGIIFNQVGDYSYQIVTPPNTPSTGVRIYSVTITDANGSQQTCSGNMHEVLGL